MAGKKMHFLVKDSLFLIHLLPFLSSVGGTVTVMSCSSLDSRSNNPGWGHCVMFLGKTLYSHSAPLHPGV